MSGLTNMTFSEALDRLKKGDLVARSGWNGKGMFLFLVPGSTFRVNREPLSSIYEEGTQINYHAHIDMKTADGTVVPWLASQSDVLAEDWVIIARFRQYRVPAVHDAEVICKMHRVHDMVEGAECL